MKGETLHVHVISLQYARSLLCTLVTLLFSLKLPLYTHKIYICVTKGFTETLFTCSTSLNFQIGLNCYQNLALMWNKVDQTGDNSLTLELLSFDISS